VATIVSFAHAVESTMTIINGFIECCTTAAETGFAYVPTVIYILLVN